ncbi:MAG: prepilin-type N-terminal cleavage/methylation domain-containing protein [Candidatus Omnitrophica bacterium]|nr:prepilin-type N-terminal cleavage/methylation domain-containing protein [Candidatus Omnitrophota bacterium]
MKGFTLFEVLITTVIFAFVAGGIYGILVIATSNYDAEEASLNLQRQARQGMNWLVRDVRQAYLSTIPNKTQSRSSIAFDIPGETGITYSIVAGQLVRKGVVVANNITSLTFAPIVGNNIQKITLEASKDLRLLGKIQTPKFSLTEQVQIRNQ